MGSRKLTIIGDGPGREDAPWDDVEHTMCINNAAHGRYCRYVATMHSCECGVHENFPASSVHPDTEVWGLVTRCESSRVDKTSYYEPVGGTSALYALLVAVYDLGYDDIEMYGVCLEEGTVYYDCQVRANWMYWLGKLPASVSVLHCDWLP